VYSVIPGPGVYAAFTTAVVVGVGEPGEETLPVRFELSQNWPNPFNPVTTIRYALDEPGRVEIEIFNVLGRKVRTLVDEVVPAGAYIATWDGTDAAGKPVSTGVYLYRLTAGDVVLTRKMLLLK
jgi:hypothetical protein